MIKQLNFRRNIMEWGPRLWKWWHLNLLLFRCGGILVQVRFHDVDNAARANVERSTWVIWAGINTGRMYQGKLAGSFLLRSVLWSRFTKPVIGLSKYVIGGGNKKAHLWVTRASWRAKRSGGKESGGEVPRKWACLDLCNFFIQAASPERSEIPLVEKRERRENFQSIMFDEERFNRIPWSR